MRMGREGWRERDGEVGGGGGGGEMRDRKIYHLKNLLTLSQDRKLTLENGGYIGFANLQKTRMSAHALDSLNYLSENKPNLETTTKHKHTQNKGNNNKNRPPPNTPHPPPQKNKKNKQNNNKITTKKPQKHQYHLYFKFEPEMVYFPIQQSLETYMSQGTVDNNTSPVPR